MSNNEIIRVLHVVRKMDLGGAESMIMNLYRYVDRNRVQFDFLVHSEERGLYDEEIEKLGGHIYRIHSMNGIKPVSYYKECLDFFQNHGEIRIVHGHLGSCAALYLWAAKKNGIYAIAHSHSAGGGRFLRDIAFKVYSYPTRYIADAFFGCSSEAGVARFGERIVRSGRYRNIPNAIDLESYAYNANLRENIRNDFSIKTDEIVLTAIGRLVDAKNPFFILDIFKEAIKQNDKVKCLWIGSGQYEEELRARIENYKLEDRIIMTGQRKDVAAILQGTDCYIMPSLYEGLPTAAIEAQASGIPCILSDTISKESEVSNLVKWESISADSSKWADKAIKMAKSNIDSRRSPVEQLRSNGYDIIQASKLMEKVYTER